MTGGASPPGSRWEAARSNRRAGTIAAAMVVAIVGLVVASTIAYEAGRDAAGSAIDCVSGDVLSTHTSVKESDAGRTIDQTLRVGNCRRITEPAFSAALTALAPGIAASVCATEASSPTTATTATPTSTTALRPGATPTTTSPCLPT